MSRQTSTSLREAGVGATWLAKEVQTARRAVRVGGCADSEVPLKGSRAFEGSYKGREMTEVLFYTDRCRELWCGEWVRVAHDPLLVTLCKRLVRTR